MDEPEQSDRVACVLNTNRARPAPAYAFIGTSLCRGVGVLLLGADELEQRAVVGSVGELYY